MSMAALPDSLVASTFIAIVTYRLASSVFSLERLWAIANYVFLFVSYRLPLLAFIIALVLSVSQKTLDQVNW